MNEQTHPHSKEKKALERSGEVVRRLRSVGYLMAQNQPLWDRLIDKAESRMDGFIYASDAPQEVLINRVRKRKPLPGKYNGTVEELMVDFKKRGYPNYGLFDRVLDSSHKNPQELAAEIKPLLMS